VPRLRKLNEGFRTPGLVIPILGTLISVVLYFTLSKFNFLAAGIALVIGALIYLYSRPGAKVDVALPETQGT
jgi:sugar phosphate permease